MTINQQFINAIGAQAPANTATVYDSTGQMFATYTAPIAIEVAREIKGVAVDDTTGEILE